MDEKRLLIIADLEGMIGVTDPSDLGKSIEYGMEEIWFVIREFNSYGIRRITVANIHNDGKCYSPDTFDGQGVPLLRGMEELYRNIAEYDAAILIGFHGMYQSGGMFDHTFRMDITELRYGEEKLGEVGVFTLWLASHRIPAYLVSGEGNFRNEIKLPECVIHEMKFPIVTDDQYKTEYGELKKAVKDAATRMTTGIMASNYPSSTLRVNVDNPDKYRIMRDFQYISAERDCFVFPSIDVMFNCMYDFTRRLNLAMENIYYDNKRFFRLYRELVGNEQYEHLRKEYQNKDLFLISLNDRLRFLDMVNESTRKKLIAYV